MRAVSADQSPMCVGAASTSDMQNVYSDSQILTNALNRLAHYLIHDLREADLDREFNPQFGMPFSEHNYKTIANQAFKGLEQILLKARNSGVALSAQGRQSVGSILELGLKTNPNSYLGWYLASDFLRSDETICVNGNVHSGQSALMIASELTRDPAAHMLLGLSENLNDEAVQPAPPS